MQGLTATTRHGVTRKRSPKRLKHTGNLFTKNQHLTSVKSVKPAVKLPQENIVKKTALLIRESVTALTENSTDVICPLTFEELD